MTAAKEWAGLSTHRRREAIASLLRDMRVRQAGAAAMRDAGARKSYEQSVEVYGLAIAVLEEAGRTGGAGG